MSKGPDDALRMRRMIWMRILSMTEGTFFAWRGLFNDYIIETYRIAGNEKRI